MTDKNVSSNHQGKGPLLVLAMGGTFPFFHFQNGIVLGGWFGSLSMIRKIAVEDLEILPLA